MPIANIPVTRRLKYFSLALLLFSTITGFSVQADDIVSEKIAHPDGLLHGSLIKHAGANAPITLIIPGSGPTTKDGDGPTLKGAVYKQLAEGLYAKGISSLRIDKRGMYTSAHESIDPNAVTMGIYARDVRGWIAKAKQVSGQSCVWLTGHSEGGLVALVSAQDPKDICGLILLSTLGNKLSTVLRNQLKANPMNQPILADALSVIDTLESGKTADISGMHPALGQLFRPSVQGFLIDSFARDPVKLVAAVTLPILIITGTNDIQTPVSESQLLHQANPKAVLKLVDGASHVMKPVASMAMMQHITAYANKDLKIDPAFAGEIAAFILKKSP